MFEMEKISTRNVFGSTLLEMAREDETIVAVGGDSIQSMALVEFEKVLPKRLFNVGIAEQNAMGVASGLASVGFKTVITGFAPFMTMRAVEQFRTFIAYPNLNVKVVGGMGGLSGGDGGVTHQGLEDYGIMRHFPNTVVAVPADASSTKKIVQAVMKHDGPAYIRLGRGFYKKVFDDNYEFEIGKSNLLVDGTDATIIVTGAVVSTALEACQQLKNENINVRVLEMPCIKPIDENAVVEAAQQTGAIVTVEDHFIMGGLGSAVAEVVCQKCPVKMKLVGIPDKFTESGEHYNLLDKYGVSVKDTVNAVKELIKKR